MSSTPITPESRATSDPPRDEDVVFEAWRTCQNPAEKDLLERELIRLLQKHATAISWLTLFERNPDVVNEAVFRALHKAGTFQGESKFSTWFQAIVRNLCMDYLRGKFERIKDKGLDELTQGELAGIAVTPAEQIDAGIELEGVLECLDPEEQEYVRLKHEGLTAEEMGKRMGTTKNAVDQAWFRIRAKIRRELRKRGLKWRLARKSE